MSRMSSYRASDVDREKVADRLRQAAAEGRILAHELEERVHAALRARTYGELDAVVADLPGGAVGQRPRPRGRQLVLDHPVLALSALTAVTLAVVILAAFAFVVSGAWIVAMVLIFLLRGTPRRRQRRGRGTHVHVHVQR